MRHVLTSVVGAREQVEVHMAEHPIEPGDRFLLCSDGLHGMVDNGTHRYVALPRPGRFRPWWPAWCRRPSSAEATTT